MGTIRRRALRVRRQASSPKIRNRSGRRRPVVLARPPPGRQWPCRADDGAIARSGSAWAPGDGTAVWDRGALGSCVSPSRRSVRFPTSRPDWGRYALVRENPDLLQTPRGGPAEARDVADPIPGQQPVFRPARLDRPAFRFERHDAPPNIRSAATSNTSQSTRASVAPPRQSEILYDEAKARARFNELAGVSGVDAVI